jgi:hypothetical protein
MHRIVLSASRRTDIPAFYMPWFMAQIEKGGFEIPHPYGAAPVRVPAAAEQVHTIVFWSKNFGPFLDGEYGQALIQKGYHLFFNFTINSPHPILEPGVPPLSDRLAQLERLADLFGARTIQWRFDPICYFITDDGREGDNLDRFPDIAERAAGAGVGICITSFVDLYRKVVRRTSASGLSLYDPPLARKVDQIVSMARCLEKLGIQLMLCCEKEVLAALPTGVDVVGAACIPNHRLAELYGPDVTLRHDTGQRVAAGCGCRHSRDIGSYRLHPCYHDCLFCYANPVSDTAGGRHETAPQTDTANG